MTLRPHPRAEVRDGQLQFETADGWTQARTRGIFYLKAPENADFAPGEHLCHSYHLDPIGDADDQYRGFRKRRLEGSVLGYSDTGNDQVERVQLELKLWERYLPPEVSPMLHAMNDLARAVVRDFFARCGVKTSDIATITGGMDTNDGLQYGIFNNYESKKLAEDGFTPHKDSGFIQVMHIAEPGLEARENDGWFCVDPVPGHLTVVLGHSFEVLTANMVTPVMACYHRVRSIEKRSASERDRISLGVYIGPRFDQDLYQYDVQGNLVVFQSFMAFQRQKASEMGYEFTSIHAGLEGTA